MKKQLVASLAAAMVLGVAGTSFAAANPFVDVPAKHWAYDSVAKLAQAGIVDGYSNGQYQGDKTISRYEMAQIVAKAMAKSDKADASNKAIIDKLSVEFASELEGLNVRVTKIEKNASSVKMTGEARIRYDGHDFDKNSNLKNDNSLKFRTRLNVTGVINDQWGYAGRLQAENDLRGDNSANVTMDNVFVKGSLFGTTATIGRFDYMPNDGLMIDSTLNGVNFAFGNVVKANVFYGKDNNTDVFGQTQVQRYEVTGLDLNYATSDKTNLKAGYYTIKDNNQVANGNTGDDSVKVWEAGFDTKLSTNWVLKGGYGASDADQENKAYFAEFDYKGADSKKVGSFGAWIGYRNLETAAAPRTTFDGAYAFNQQAKGGKGYEVGFSYAPMLNSVMKFKYADVKSTLDNVKNDKSKYYQAQVEFFF